jgi:hypothetical protein
MTKNAKIITTIGILSLGIGVIVYMVMKKAGSKQPLAGGTQPTTPTVGLPGINYFPLVMGSNNPKVGELQSILGFTGTAIDSSFGPKTAAALQKYNLTQIADDNALQALRKQIEAPAKKANNKNRAQTLLDTYNSDPKAKLIVLTKNTVSKVAKRTQANGTVVYEPLNLAFSYANTGRERPKGDPDFIGVSANGFMVLKDKDGYYLADPNAWTVTTP